jgi:hypothetical protein
MTKRGAPRKKAEDKVIRRLFSFDREVSKRLDKVIPDRKRSSFVCHATKKELDSFELHDNSVAQENA